MLLVAWIDVADVLAVNAAEYVAVESLDPLGDADIEIKLVDEDDIVTLASAAELDVAEFVLATGD